MAIELLKRLEAYAAELDGVLSRFTKSRDGIHILENDDPRFRELVIEFATCSRDHLPNEDYAGAVVTTFNDGISNFIGSPSFKSVETIRGIVKAALVRVRTNPGILSRGDKVSHPVETKTLELPERVTLRWLTEHVPYRFWLSSGGALVAAYLLGLNTKAFVKAAFGL